MNITAQTILSRSFSAKRAIFLASVPGSCAPLALMVGLVLLAMAGRARATVLGYEPFNYTTGSFTTGTAATGNGFTGNWTCGAAGTITSGLIYTGLPVANNALSSGSGRQFVSLSSALSTGTKWISFLFKSSGNSGANINGVYFANGGTGLWFGFGLNPVTQTQGQLGIGSMNTVGNVAQGTTGLLQLGLGNYGNTYLVALQIQFNTSDNNDPVTVYLNPVANQATSGVTAAGTNSTFDVGTISEVGLNIQGAGEIIVDEIHVGDTYGDAVGYVSIPPNAPTGLNATPGANLVSLSWTAATGSPTSYRVKRSTTSGSGYVNVATNTAPTVTSTDSVTGGTTYYYVVSAVNASGESANSSEASGLAATAGDAQVALSWTASSFATGYNVKRSSGLNIGTPYYYVVSATGPGGTSFDTPPVRATPVSHMAVLNIVRGAGIAWFASNSVTYQVQWSSALLGTNTVWNDLGGSIAGNGATNTVFDPIGPPHNFFQVLSIQ